MTETPTTHKPGSRMDDGMIYEGISPGHEKTSLNIQTQRLSCSSLLCLTRT